MKKRYHLLLVLLLLIYSKHTFAQITTNELPPGLTEPSFRLSNADIIRIDPPDMSVIHAEDANNDTIPGIFRRSGVAIPIDLNSDIIGSWTNLANGDKFWTTTIVVENPLAGADL